MDLVSPIIVSNLRLHTIDGDPHEDVDMDGSDSDSWKGGKTTKSKASTKTKAKTIAKAKGRTAAGMKGKAKGKPKDADAAPAKPKKAPLKSKVKGSSLPVLDPPSKAKTPATAVPPRMQGSTSPNLSGESPTTRFSQLSLSVITPDAYAQTTTKTDSVPLTSPAPLSNGLTPKAGALAEPVVAASVLSPDVATWTPFKRLKGEDAAQNGKSFMFWFPYQKELISFHLRRLPTVATFAIIPIDVASSVL